MASFINHYIFPGGYLPSITELLNHITQQSKGTLIVEKVENIAGHYAKALRLWKENFLGNFDMKIKPALLREHPEMSKEGVEVFRRKWEVGIPHINAHVEIFLTRGSTTLRTVRPASSPRHWVML